MQDLTGLSGRLVPNIRLPVLLDQVAFILGQSVKASDNSGLVVNGAVLIPLFDGLEFPFDLLDRVFLGCFCAEPESSEAFNFAVLVAVRDVEEVRHLAV